MTQSHKKALTGHKLSPKPTKAQKLAQAEKNLERFQVIQDERFKELVKTIGTVWSNQVELAKSETRLDEQFCVLSRLAIRGINEILVRIGSEDLITEKVIETAFKEWHGFRSRSDFRSFMLEWFLGKPLSELPPEPKKEETPVAPDQKAEGTQEFGGDYGPHDKSSSGNETASKEPQQDSNIGQADAVSQGQNLDNTPLGVGQGNGPTLS